ATRAQQPDMVRPLVQGRGLVDRPVLVDQEVGADRAGGIAVEGGLGGGPAGLVDDDAVHRRHVTTFQGCVPACLDERAAHHPVLVDTEHASSLMCLAAILQAHGRYISTPPAARRPKWNLPWRTRRRAATAARSCTPRCGSRTARC